MTKEQQYGRLIKEILDLDKSDIDDDNEFDTESRKHILERDEYYSDLLKHFVTITKERNKAKEKNKWIYFWVIMTSLVALDLMIISVVIVLLIKCNAEQLIDSIPVFVTAIAGFVSSIIAIPLAITKYLFSTKEDKYITEIISHTQEHDLSGRRILKTITEAAKAEEKAAS